jgi:hopanoid biosynthesis associated RND transporter like protein HpnN
LCDLLAAAFDPSGAYHSPWPDLSAESAAAHPWSNQGPRPGGDRFGFVLLKLCEDKSSSFAQNAEAIRLLHAIVAESRTHYPELRIGLTGLPVMEHDEMQSSQNSTIVASALEFGGLVLVLVAGFGGLRHSLLAMSSLAFGMVWSFGYVALTIGHLNILSSAFGAILIGLGTNYGIYSIARYLHLRGGRMRADEALMDTAQSVAPGITVGAATTAIAFFVAGFTDFPGVAELGIVAGGGIILCWLAAVTVLPAIVHLVDRKASRRPVPVPLDFHLWLRPLVSRPRRVIAIGMAVTALLGLGMTRLWYDHNLLHLQPAGLESVQWEERLLSEMGQGAWFAVSMADTPEELAARKAAFLRLPTVDRVDEIASLLPSDQQQKQPIVRRIAQRLADLPDRPPQIPVPPQDQMLPVLHRLRAVLSVAPQTAGVTRELAALEEAIGQLPPSQYYARLSGYLDRAARELLQRLHALRAAADPQPPQWADLPGGLVDRFVGRSGKLLLRVYGKGSLWDMEAMEQFVADVRGVDPKATGNPMQVFEASRQMKRSYEQAALYAVLIIVPLVFLDFRRPRDTFLAVLPLGLGMIQLFGLMGLLDVPLNAANIIALPLMLGMAIDNGVHIMHDFHGQRGRYRMSHATSIAVVLDSVTTMVGFAVLMVADHRGLQGLGRVMTIGMACCLFSSLIILPAILSLMTQHREQVRQPIRLSRESDAVEEEGPGEPAPAAIPLRPDPGHHPRPPARRADVAPGEVRSGRESVRRAA